MKYGRFVKKKGVYGVFTDPTARENGWTEITGRPHPCSDIINENGYCDQIFKIVEDYPPKHGIKANYYIIEFSDGVRFVIHWDEIEEFEYLLPEELFQI